MVKGRGLLTDLRVDKRLQTTEEEHSANGTTRKVYSRVTFSLVPPAVDDCWKNEGLDAQGACDMMPATSSDGGRDGSNPLQPPCGPLLFFAVRADRTRLAGSIVQWVDVGEYNFKFTLKKHYRSDGSVDDIVKGCKVSGRMFGGYGRRAMSLSYFVPLAPGHDEAVHVTNFLEVWARSGTSVSVVDVGPGTSISGPVGFAGGECSGRGMGGQGGLPATPLDQEVAEVSSGDRAGGPQVREVCGSDETTRRARPAPAQLHTELSLEREASGNIAGEEEVSAQGLFRERSVKKTQSRGKRDLPDEEKREGVGALKRQRKVRGIARTPTTREGGSVEKRKRVGGGDETPKDSSTQRRTGESSGKQSKSSRGKKADEGDSGEGDDDVDTNLNAFNLDNAFFLEMQTGVQKDVVLSMRDIRNIWKIKGKPRVVLGNASQKKDEVRKWVQFMALAMKKTPYTPLWNLLTEEKKRKEWAEKLRYYLPLAMADDSVFTLGDKFYEEWSKGKLLASDGRRWTEKPPTHEEVAKPGLSTVSDSQELKKHVWYVKVDDPSLKKGKGKPKKGAEEKTFYVQVPKPDVHCWKELVDLTDREKKRQHGVLNLNVVWVQTSSKKLAEQGKFSVKEMVDIIKMDRIMLRLWNYMEFEYEEMDKRKWNANSTFFRSKKQLFEEFKDKGLDDKLWNESRKFFTDSTYVNKCPRFLGCQHDNNIKRTATLINDQHFLTEWKRVVLSVITGDRAKGKKSPRGIDECINIMWTRTSALTTLT
ncbi:hypothetical protein CBR_g56936 [Chara braunii]|uniref:Uncharacterized protein n=1 Tax=Chara braunii TaxID=69332 RepID=A0A388MDW0_CHABU|nr:hypothetical protein CBR_g56936 [Chara braunii]|eukprot:GBG92758.1 hypothetical protein CBR_g56936 [Chara braunii]